MHVCLGSVSFQHPQISISCTKHSWPIKCMCVWVLFPFNTHRSAFHAWSIPDQSNAYMFWVFSLSIPTDQHFMHQVFLTNQMHVCLGSFSTPADQHFMHQAFLSNQMHVCLGSFSSQHRHISILSTNHSFPICNQMHVCFNIITATQEMPFIIHVGPGITLCGWLGSKHQLTNSLMFCTWRNLPKPVIWHYSRLTWQEWQSWQLSISEMKKQI